MRPRHLAGSRRAGHGRRHYRGGRELRRTSVRAPGGAGGCVMHLRKLQAHWNALGDTDPLWAILTDPARKGGKWEREEFFRIGEQEIAEVLRAAGERGLRTRRGVALDFGCGVGRLTQALCAHFEECCGVDIAPSMIRLAREYNRYGARCRYELHPAADLRLFPDERFDFVYSSLVLQHMRPRYARRYIGEFLRVLARGGGLIFRLPAGLSGCGASCTGGRKTAWPRWAHSWGSPCARASKCTACPGRRCWR